MSRITNSILLRFGINTFWSSGFFKPLLLNNALQLNIFFDLFFRNYFFRVLKIVYSSVFVNVFVYYLKDHKFLFIHRYLLLKRNSLLTLIVRKNYSFLIKPPLVIEKVARRKVSKFKRLTFLIHFSYFLIFLVYTCKRGSNLSENIVFLKCSLVRIKSGLKKHYPFFNHWKLKLCNHIIKFKLLSLVGSDLIFSYTKKSLNVIITPLISRKQNIKLPFLFRFLYNTDVKTKLYIIFLSFLFLKSSILNSFINIFLRTITNKKHISSLIFFFKQIKIIFKKQIVPIVGVKFQIAGRLNGKLRKSKFGYLLGSVKLMSLFTYCDYSSDYVFTQYGSFSLRLWLCEFKEITSLSKKNNEEQKKV